jgi:putative SOS response-associated peptidase YedK
MCYVISFKVNSNTILRLADWGLAYPFEPVPLLYGFNFGDAPILKMSPEGPCIGLAHWELIPYWVKNMAEVKEGRKKFTTLNATSEKLQESKMFKEAAVKRRCLVPVTGFYEWRHYRPEGAKKDEAYPYHITVADQDYFYMAGIWQPWTDKETGETMDTFAIVTTKANELMSKIHNTKLRMPTILTEDLAAEWIKPGLQPDKIQEIASFQYNSDEMSAYPIRKEFRTLEDPTEAFDYIELPALSI